MATQCEIEFCSKCMGNKNSVFFDLDNKTAEHLNQHRVINHYKKGQSLFLENNPSFGVFCISSGKVKLVKTNSDGHLSIIRLINPGEMLGYNSVLADEPYYASAVVLEDCTICFFEKNIILDFILNSPLVMGKIINSLCSSLKRAHLASALKSHHNAREKFATLLLGLIEVNGIKDGDTCKIDIRLTREELASLIGSTMETVSRMITEFKAESIIDEHDKYIFVLNESKLKEFAGVS